MPETLHCGQPDKIGACLAIGHLTHYHAGSCCVKVSDNFTSKPMPKRQPQLNVRLSDTAWAILYHLQDKLGCSQTQCIETLLRTEGERRGVDASTLSPLGRLGQQGYKPR